MAIINNLKPQVDLPVFEWLRFAPTATQALSAVAFGDGLNERYMYYLTGTSFYRYDTISDSYQILATPPTPAVTGVTLRYSSYGGYRGNVISAGASTAVIAGLEGFLLKGSKIRITGGAGVGQDRTITAITESVISDHGVVTGASANSLTDTTKRWLINQFVGYQVRVVYGTGQSQVRKVLYNDATNLYFYDVNYQQIDPWNNTPFSATAPYALPVSTAGSQSYYYIESSTATVDSAWTVQPDYTSTFVAMTGGVWMATAIAVAPWMSLQYYDVASDTWTSKTSLGGHLLAALGTDFSIERTGEVAGIFLSGTATSGTARALVDSGKTMTIDRYCNYQLRITGGTGMGQRRRIVANSATSFEPEIPFTTIPDATSTYAVLGNTDMIYLAGNGASSMYKYHVEKDAWVQGSPIDFGQASNISIKMAGRETLTASSIARNTGGITAVTATPVAAGSGYVVGEIITLATGAGGKVRVTSVNAGAVTGLELYSCGSGYTVATQSQSATTGSGTACTCAITAIGTVGRITTAQNANIARGNTVWIYGCVEAAWNTSYTVIGADSLTTFDIITTATAVAAASNSQSTTVLVDATKNWGVNELTGRLVSINVAGSSPTTQIRRIISNTATALTLQSAITAAVNGTSRYAIYEPQAFGRDEQWKVLSLNNNGRASGGTTTTLIDASKTWYSNQWLGYKVKIMAGTGVGNELAITANTNTTLTYATQTFTPDATTKYLIMDTFGLATSVGTTTTLADTTKNWTVNQWAGKRMKITSGTGLGQEAIIASNTATVLTFGAVTTAPGTDSTYTIFGAPARSTGFEINWVFNNSNTANNGMYLFMPRGGGSNIIDRYSIVTGTWDFSVFISPQSETLPTGTMYCYDGADSIYMTIGATGRVLRLNVNTFKVDACATQPYSQGAAIIGNRMEIIKTADGLYYLYIWRHSGQEVFRVLVFW